MKPLFLSIIYFLVNYSSAEIKWDVNDIDSPFINPHFCNVDGVFEPLICDPENSINIRLKFKLNQLLKLKNMYYGSCLCSRNCASTNYKRKLVAPVLFVSDIDTSNSSQCNGDRDYKCFSRALLTRWNLGSCEGHEIFILVTKTKMHLEFGDEVSQKMPLACQEKLKNTFFINFSILINLRVIIHRIINSLQHPCSCNNQCGIQQHKWFVNMTFVVGLCTTLMIVTAFNRHRFMHRFRAQSRPARCSNAAEFNMILHAINERVLRDRGQNNNRSSVGDSNVVDSGDLHGDLVPPNYTSLDKSQKGSPPPAYDNIAAESHMELTDGAVDVDQISVDSLPPPYSDPPHNDTTQHNTTNTTPHNTTT